MIDLQWTEQHIAIDRWKDMLCAQCSKISKAFPDEWKKKCIETYDPDFVRSKVLVQSIIDHLGQDYSTISAWLRSLDKITPICTAFTERFKDELALCRETVADAAALTATILAYNILVFRFPKMTSNERRQSFLGKWWKG